MSTLLSTPTAVGNLSPSADNEKATAHDRPGAVNSSGNDGRRGMSPGGSVAYPYPRNANPIGPQPADPTQQNAYTTSFGWPILGQPLANGKKLTERSTTIQRAIFIAVVAGLNTALAIGALYSKTPHVPLAFILFFKAKDCLCALLSILAFFVDRFWSLFKPSVGVSQRWILSLIPTYNESEEQILKCIESLNDNDLGPHRQVMVVIMDGKPKELRSEMSRTIAEIERPYHTLKDTSGSLRIAAGWIRQAPVILIEKAANCGKKDSLVLGHDLFNSPRDNMPLYTQLLRNEIWQNILPTLTRGEEFSGFHGVFCTDADSKLAKGALRRLMDALVRDKNAIAAAGTVYVELEHGLEWSFWNLYQQFQYTFGQFVRRRAEGLIGKVTCLPGCVTMTAVRKEMAGAIQKYACPATTKCVLHHQVQNLGTDRRLTYCMLSQGTHLRTLFVPDAVSETVAPQSFRHYISQRRRWGSNAYFNNYFYFGGESMAIIIRLAAAIDIARQTFVYFRIVNTVFFIKALVDHFVFWDILPLIIVGQLPLVWYIITVLLESELRRRAFKLFIGLLINKLVSPFLALVIFTEVSFNLGNNAWGLSGITATSPPSTMHSREIREEKGKSKYVAAEEGRAVTLTEPVPPIPRSYQRPLTREGGVLRS